MSATGGESSRSDTENEKLKHVQKLMKMAAVVYEARGYAGQIEVEMQLGIFTETSTLIIDRVSTCQPPWPKCHEMYGPSVIKEALEKEDNSSRSVTLLRQLVRRLEDRARAWSDPYFYGTKNIGCDDDLSSIPTSRDPLLGASGSIGFSLFGIMGWQVSISISVYASRLLRWRQRTDLVWPLTPVAPSRLDAFQLLAGDDQDIIPGTRVRDLLKTDENNEEESLSSISAALSELDEKQLRQAWHLADVTRDGALDFQEFVLFVHLVEWHRNSLAPLPHHLPAELVPPNARRSFTMRRSDSSRNFDSTDSSPRTPVGASSDSERGHDDLAAPVAAAATTQRDSLFNHDEEEDDDETQERRVAV